VKLSYISQVEMLKTRIEKLVGTKMKVRVLDPSRLSEDGSSVVPAPLNEIEEIKRRRHISLEVMSSRRILRVRVVGEFVIRG
jgi:hypothetical protein